MYRWRIYEVRIMNLSIGREEHGSVKARRSFAKKSQS